ncbi:unnamed protein product (macronuclear) [Paramecium tetraurelia]|uniref:Macro domain-containing protein n=1 Tax=Paramecium tetraurelia TaxID=5888 RepID=A0CEM7_PARTE|nr:uncharacterized protein GSPATT00037683001 [Paramecium tetraurelia]CAK69244.1 unnamed protein product [Paramecium tetraurelia]|eukprot:XP_001436641.1 hypothetical protein (macronuclear) [Paramecium tetraurelia strain d4-2]
MGNNFCYSKIDQESTISQLICLQKLNECNVYLTIGKIENEAVDCMVQENDQFQKFPVPCKFQTNDNTYNFIKSTEKNSKNYIQVLLKNYVNGAGQNHNEGEKQKLYEIIQDVLKIADERQMRSIAFPVFLIKDYTTSATIMLMAIKIFIVEQICQRLTKIYIILNSIEQVSSFKWVFSQVFDIRKSQRLYDSSINEDWELRTTELLNQNVQIVKSSMP